MAITDDLRKTFTDPTPLYFAAGTADLAVQQALKVPALLEQLAAEAPGRIEAVRNADPKAVQSKVTSQAKEAQATVQAKVTEVLGGFDADFKKIGETAQDLALRGVGVAAEYAVKARETYDKVAEHGEQTVRSWRGEAAEEITEIAVAVEPEPKKAEQARPTTVRSEPAARTRQARIAEPRSEAEPASTGTGEKPAARKPVARKTTARKPAAKKDTPPVE
ncbi:MULTISPECIES: hypothetical protein [Streptomyces]|uniref:Uncharacterized protein n=2 Tax=Streptomyces TaxID=1883 RepID=A0A646KS45_STRJU|nr:MULTISPECIES: hypothetical protein [Streptomyces]MQS39135.1 hypothetical protein [Streptomyces katsurahamanus]MQT04857.1 hypothetical protein [Streptomyces jumonjinensis]